MDNVNEKQDYSKITNFQNDIIDTVWEMENGN